MKPRSGEFFAPILCGPFRGVPAIHLLDYGDKVDVADVPALVDAMSEMFGLNVGKGKGFLFTDRHLPPMLLDAMRQSGLLVVLEVPNEDQAKTGNVWHRMVVAKDARKVRSDAHSYVYYPDPEEYVREPDFSEVIKEIPRFLLVPTLTGRILEFIKNTQYPWSLQKPDYDTVLFSVERSVPK